jgi:hypothetical protein
VISPAARIFLLSEKLQEGIEIAKFQILINPSQVQFFNIGIGKINSMLKANTQVKDNLSKFSSAPTHGDVHEKKASP